MDDVFKYKMRPGNNWGVGVLLYNPQKQLLMELRRDNGTYGTPGGTVKVGETPLEALIRETREETGLTIKNPRFIDAAVDDSAGKVWVSFRFIASEYSGEMKAQKSEVTKLEWMDINKVKKLKLFGPTKNALESQGLI